MARNPYASNINVAYEAGGVDIVKSYKYLVREFGLSKFPKYLEDAVVAVADRRFNAYMLANKEEYKHVFEWGATTTAPGDRLWQTLKKDGLFTYTFLPSREYVPTQFDDTKYFHVFKEKARVMEEAPVVLIEPQNSAYLRWRGSNGEEVRNYEGVITQVAGGRFQNKFSSAFLLFWATGAGGTIQEFAHEVATSPDFQQTYEKAQIAGLKRRITNAQKKAANGDAQAKAMAAAKIKEFEREIIERGKRL